MPDFSHTAAAPLQVQRYARLGAGSRREWVPAGEPCSTLAEAIEGVRAMAMRGLDGRDGRSTAARVVDRRRLPVDVDVPRAIFQCVHGLPVETTECDPDELDDALAETSGDADPILEPCGTGARATVYKTASGQTVGYLLPDGSARIARGMIPLPHSARLEGTPFPSVEVDFGYTSDDGSPCRIHARVAIGEDGDVVAGGLIELISWTVAGVEIGKEISRIDRSFIVMACDGHLREPSAARAA